MRLLAGTPDEIQSTLDQMKGQSKALTEEIYEICWYMRGGVTREEAWHLSHNERKIIAEQIKKRIEVSKESHTPII